MKTAKDLMTSPAECLAPDETLVTAARMLSKYDVGSMPVVDGDKLLVAIDNLLSNAIDFSPANGMIDLQASLDGQTLRIVCRDQGPGVAAADAERIFSPFVQGEREPPEPRQGSGVGLSIVRELMSALGGRAVLLASDATAPGAAFMLELPCGKQE